MKKELVPTLSVKNPWAVLLGMGIKDIENRTWKTPHRGRTLLHISGSIDPRFKNDHHCFTQEQLDAINDILDVREAKNRSKLFDNKGCIIGEFNLVDCVVNHDNIWAEQTPEEHIKKPIYNWIIKDMKLFDEPIKNVLGKLNIWKYEI